MYHSRKWDYSYTYQTNLTKKILLHIFSHLHWFLFLSYFNVKARKWKHKMTGPQPGKTVSLFTCKLLRRRDPRACSRQRCSSPPTCCAEQTRTSFQALEGTSLQSSRVQKPGHPPFSFSASFFQTLEAVFHVFRHSWERAEDSRPSGAPRSTARAS